MGEDSIGMRKGGERFGGHEVAAQGDPRLAGQIRTSEVITARIRIRGGERSCRDCVRWTTARAPHLSAAISETGIPHQADRIVMVA